MILNLMYKKIKFDFISNPTLNTANSFGKHFTEKKYKKR